MFRRVALLGLGLIGGSFALAVRQAGLASVLIGFDPDRESLAQGVVDGVIEQGVSHPQDAVADADLVVLAAPVRAIVMLLAEIGPGLRPGTLVLDLGSTKGEIVAAMEGLPPGVRAVGGHPMAGKEVAGLRHAEPGLFQGATFALCETSHTDVVARTLVEALATGLGARPLWLTALDHDALVATTSHLPYLLSVALVRAGLAVDDPRVWQLVASGFRDTSRLAASDERMMGDILQTNREALLTALAQLQAELAALSQALSQEDPQHLAAMIAPAATHRRTLFLPPR